MKKLTIYSCFLLLIPFIWGCKKNNYPGGEISPFIALYDIRTMYKGQDLVLTEENMFGSRQLAVVVVSDHSGSNLPAGLLVVQDKRRLDKLRGISIPLGAAAGSFVPGDSLLINVAGKTLTRKEGILQIANITEGDITRVATNVEIPLNKVTTSQMLANPGDYESTLSAIVKGGFDPLPSPKDVMSGDKTLNDGFGNITLHTEAGAKFSGDSVPVLANYYGIVFNKLIGDSLAPQFRIRTGADKVTLSSVIEIPPVVIAGFISDVKGTDANNEYIQLLATQDINFAETPFAVVTTNNANASTPTGFPTNGWAAGDIRTYKFNLTSGRASKGTFFYVGAGSKLINGDNSTSIATSNWIRSFNYSTTAGDGFGTKTTNLLANSGNAFGIAVFDHSNVTVNSKPVDVIFTATGGSLFTAGPPAKGYKIANTDWYDVKNPITLADQPYYRQGTNTLNLAYNTADVGYFIMLGGVYNTELGRWTTARAQNNVTLTKTSTLVEIEGTGATTVK